MAKKEEKNPVGRPKLAREDVLKKAKASIYISIAICIMLSVCFFAEMKNEDPLKFTYHLTFEKLFGAIENKNGFIAKESYDKESNFGRGRSRKHGTFREYPRKTARYVRRLSAQSNILCS